MNEDVSHFTLSVIIPLLLFILSTPKYILFLFRITIELYKIKECHCRIIYYIQEIENGEKG